MIRGLALCAGIGGLELGVRLALGDRYRCVGYCEQDTCAAATLVARMGDKALDQAPVWGDLTTFDGRPWRGKVDLLTAGYPCQPFSYVGRRGGERDPRHLWPEVVRILGETGAAMLFCENVPGHLSLGFERFLGDLHGMGFRVAATLAAAEDLGAPHRRQRLFFLAIREDRGWGGAVGDTVGSRLEERGSGPVAGPFPAPWPPGPADAWDGIPEWLWPVASEPLLRGVADGAPSRVDRLRMLGNGVVPVVAAVAFLDCWEALNDG